MQMTIILRHKRRAVKLIDPLKRKEPLWLICASLAWPCCNEFHDPHRI